jgi:hypothetical protein
MTLPMLLLWRHSVRPRQGVPDGTGANRVDSCTALLCQGESVSSRQKPNCCEICRGQAAALGPCTAAADGAQQWSSQQWSKAASSFDCCWAATGKLWLQNNYHCFEDIKKSKCNPQHSSTVPRLHGLTSSTAIHHRWLRSAFQAWLPAAHGHHVTQTNHLL